MFTEHDGNPNNYLGSTELHPLKSPNNKLPSDHAKCLVYTASNSSTPRSDCRRGDQSYATVERSAVGLPDFQLPAGKKDPYPSKVENSKIAKPETQNKSKNDEQVLEIGHFETASRPFRIVGARPPNPDPDPVTNVRETLHKVGVTTGWTEGTLADGADPTCPGGHLGTSDNKHATGYHECRSEATYVSLPGDSGAPVFVRKEGSATEVLLVGVHYGGELEGASREYARFIPIDRIYAEALINGYDWDANWLRPLPRLEDFTEESLTVNSSIGTATAVFDNADFSLSPAIVYEVGLFRRDDKGRWSSDPIAKFDTITHKDPVAEFTGLDIPDDAKGSDYRVKVRMNALIVTGSGRNSSLANRGYRGGWGPLSTIAARMISYPEKLVVSTPPELHQGQTGKLMVAAAALAPESGYRLQLSSENQNAAFDPECSLFKTQTDLPEKAESFEREIELHGCKPGKIEVEADLSRDDLLVALDSGSGTVREPPAVAITGLSEAIPRGAARELTVDITDLDPGSSYRLQLSASEGSGFGEGCTDQTAAADLAAGATSYAGRFELHGCTPGDHTLDVSLSLDGEQLATEEHGFKVLDQVLALGDLPKSVIAGGEFALSVRAGNLDPKSTYRLSARSVGGSGNCETAGLLLIPAGSESFGGVLKLKACAPGQFQFQVDLASAGSTLKSITGKVTVIPAATTRPSGSVTVTGLGGTMRVGQPTTFAVRAGGLAGAHAYTVQISLAGADVGFDSACGEKAKSLAVPDGSRGFTSGQITLHACGKGLAGITVRLVSSGETVAASYLDVAVIG